MFNLTITRLSAQVPIMGSKGEDDVAKVRIISPLQVDDC